MVAPLPLLALGLWLAAGARGPDRLMLPRHETASTRFVLTFVAVSLCAACVLCAWHRVAGLLALSLVLVGVAGFWPSVQENQFSGPVLLTFSDRHGLHRNDLLAVVPLGLALAAVVAASTAHSFAGSRGRRPRLIRRRGGRWGGSPALLVDRWCRDERSRLPVPHGCGCPACRNVREVGLDRAARDAELLADHPVGAAAEQQLDHLVFGGGQAGPARRGSHGACAHVQTDERTASVG